MLLVRPDRKQYEQTQRFLNKTFKQKFESVLPKIYCNDRFRDSHLVAVEDDKIIGAVANIPIDWRIDDMIIHGAGIGMVATHPRYRGRGVMKSLLDQAIERCKQDGTQVVFLSGYLDRYKRFGFYPSGIENLYTLRADKGCVDKAQDYTFELLKGERKEIETLRSIYEQQAVRWERKDFFDTLCTWKSKAYIVKKSGHVLGYLVKNRYGADISEIVVPTQELVATTTAWIIRNNKDSVKVCVSPYDMHANEELILHSENYCQINAENWLILDYTGVIETLLSAKVKRQKVASGRAVLQIDAVKYLISVDGDNVDVTQSDGQADIALTKEQATRLLFGPKIVACENSWLDTILPLPIYIPSIDRV
ncbi:MAG: GNAT family N-acetyltransferase [Christensenellales bacterium]